MNESAAGRWNGAPVPSKLHLRRALNFWRLRQEVDGDVRVEFYRTWRGGLVIVGVQRNA